MDSLASTRRGRVPARLRLVPLVATLYLTSGCGFWDQPAKDGEQEIDPDYAAVCSDGRTSDRVDDDQCRHAPVGFAGSDLDAQTYQYAAEGRSTTTMWYYVDAHAGRTMPPVGGRVSGGTYTTPQHHGRDPRKPAMIIRERSVPREGGPVNKATINSIQRGGLGVPSNNSKGSGT